MTVCEALNSAYFQTNSHCNQIRKMLLPASFHIVWISDLERFSNMTKDIPLVVRGRIWIYTLNKLEPSISKHYYRTLHYINLKMRRKLKDYFIPVSSLNIWRNWNLWREDKFYLGTHTLLNDANTDLWSFIPLHNVKDTLSSCTISTLQCTFMLFCAWHINWESRTNVRND